MSFQQKILVPCDYSELSLHALLFACGLAANLQSEVCVLSVIADETQEESQRDLYKAEFAAVAGSGLWEGITVRQLIRTGKLVEEILKAIDELKVTLLVVGTRGSRGWDGVFAGSYAGKLVRASPVPVFSIKQPARPQQIRDIVFPCDFEKSQSSFINAMKKMQAVFSGRLHLLHVITGREDDKKLMSAMQDFAGANALQRYTLNIRTDESEEKGIIRFATEIGADMIAMTTHSRDLSHLYLTSIAANVVNHSRIPTWTYSGA
jgi:nucleotide-binding universal stress UspA family protein